MKPRAGSVLLAAAATSAACAARPVLDPSVVPVEASVATDEVVPLPEPLATGRGFDALVAMTSPDAIQAGDRLLYRIRHHVDGVEEVLYLAIRLGERDGTLYTEPARLEWDGEELAFPLASPNRRAELVVHDVASGTSTTTTLLVPEVSMRENLYGSAAVEDALDAEARASEDDLRRLAVGVTSAATLFRLWQENEVLRELLERIVGRPSALSMLRALVTFDRSYSISVGLSGKQRVPADLPRPIGTLDAWRVPMTVSAAGQTLLRLDVQIAAPAAPLSAGTGLVSFRGVHPTNPNRWIAVDLVGARRGP